MIRAVVDTNIVVSSAIKDGNERRLLRLAAVHQFELCISPAIVTEYEGVLRRPKFRLSAEEVSRTISWIRAVSVLVEPGIALKVSPDADDNRFLECAEAADADYLVTGNRRHFPKRWKSTLIVNAREFLDILTPRP